MRTCKPDTQNDRLPTKGKKKRQRFRASDNAIRIPSTTFLQLPHGNYAGGKNNITKPRHEHVLVRRIVFYLKRLVCNDFSALSFAIVSCNKPKNNNKNNDIKGKITAIGSRVVVELSLLPVAVTVTPVVTDIDHDDRNIPYHINNSHSISPRKSLTSEKRRNPLSLRRVWRGRNKTARGIMEIKDKNTILLLTALARRICLVSPLGRRRGSVLRGLYVSYNWRLTV